MESIQSMVVVAGRSLAITLYYVKKLVIWNDFKSNHKISNPNQITRFSNQILVLQIKSLCVVQS